MSSDVWAYKIFVTFYQFIQIYCDGFEAISTVVVAREES
jgi:hypothetical protein